MQFEVNIDYGPLDLLFNDFTNFINNPTPLLNGIGSELVDLTESNFNKEAGPTGDWHLLAPLTRKARTKNGTWPGKILQVSGFLASSINYTTDNNSVSLHAGSGPSKKYAAIHQFGGNAGRNRSVKIPARPYLPIIGNSKDAKLAPIAIDAIQDMVNDYLLKVLERNR